MKKKNPKKNLAYSDLYTRKTEKKKILFQTPVLETFQYQTINCV